MINFQRIPHQTFYIWLLIKRDNVKKILLMHILLQFKKISLVGEWERLKGKISRP